MDTARELQHLAWADEHLRQAYQRIERLREIITDFEGKGLAKESARALALLIIMLRSLELMEQHHDQILNELDRGR